MDINICMSENLYIFAAQFGKCGEICLLATTLKNAKNHMMFCVFVTAPHDVGLFCCPAPPLIHKTGQK